MQRDVPDRNADFYLFRILNEARNITERWLGEYNTQRPHKSLNNLT
ncbi:integrase core domain-containing protein [Pantoea sp. paga]